MISPLEMTLLLLLASVVGVVVFRSLNLPPMLGYLTVGIWSARTRSASRRIWSGPSISRNSAWCS